MLSICKLQLLFKLIESMFRLVSLLIGFLSDDACMHACRAIFAMPYTPSNNGMHLSLPTVRSCMYLYRE
jgi:hypothetical protein